MDTAVATVRELLNFVNAGNPVDRLRPEILVACFVRLPFRSRIRASHVSRSWRAAALAYPQVWSEIVLPHRMRNRPALLATALSRAGDLPVDLKVESMYPPNTKFLDCILAPYRHQLRRVEWRAMEQSGLWSLPAAGLEYLDCFRGLELAPGFLGGKSGVLSSLHLGSCNLPPLCPALSTVVDLYIRSMRLVTDASSFRRLFELFPQLESLSLTELDQRFSESLPPGPAPPTLRRLNLETQP
ncbi:hypothetical protein AURDEDRAFT_144651, partial [Auricularia subglabra TFB-10046 SS5]